MRKRLVDLLRKVTCNGRNAYNTAFIVSAGSPLSIFTSWSVGWTAGRTHAKYYSSTSMEARTLLRRYDVDYAVTTNGLSRLEAAMMPDAVVLPLTFSAIALGKSTHQILIFG